MTTVPDCRRAVRVRRVLAVSSSGGHWSELLRVAPALEGHAVTWVTTNPQYRASAPPGDFATVRDASLWDKAGLVLMAAELARLIFYIQPDVTISTGAAPGYFALRLAKAIGTRTIWLDSIANADQLSLSGRKIARWADLWLTQWPHLARPGGPDFLGSVL